MQRVRSFLVFAAALLVGWLAVSLPARAATQVLSDSFTGATTAMTWQAYGSACLTAGGAGGSIPACASGTAGGYNGNTPDATNRGALLLTRAVANDFGAVVSTASFPTSGGLSVTFMSYAYGGTGADGLSFFLVDASQPMPATWAGGGGGLGYLGVSGGVLGIGVDEYGNFASAANSVALRGATAQGNPYLLGATPGYALWSSATTRRTATSHSYTVSITSAGLVSIVIDGTTYLSNYNAAALLGTLPAYLRVGLGAGTGGATNIHAINSFSVSSLGSSNLLLTKTTSVISDPTNGTTKPKAIPGATIRYCTIVTNPSASAASSVTVSEPLASLPVTFVAGSIKINGTATNGTCAWNGTSGGTYSGSTVSASLGSLAAGASRTVYFDALVN